MSARTKRIVTGVLFAGVWLPAAGCGYSTARPFNREVKTVYVPMLNSKEFRRRLEYRLTEALVKRIQLDTPYKVVPKPQADTILTGEVLPFRQAAFARDFKTAQPREIQLTAVVQYTWKDLRTGKILSRKQHELKTQATDYIPPVGESFFMASQEAIERLAERIVEGMEQDDW